MSVLLRVVLDQLVRTTDPDLAMASDELASALIQSAPDGCEVGAIIPSGAAEFDVKGLSEVRRLAMGGRELAAAWQLGVTAGVGGGLIHSPTLMAPLTRHDRVNDNDQTVVTVWDLQPWDHPEEFSRTALAWNKAMFKRARKHADAIVVPTHAIARRISELADVGSRVRVISGAAPTGFSVPVDAVGRRRVMEVPEAVVLMAGDAQASSALAAGFQALAGSGAGLPVVVLDVPAGQEPVILEHAEAAGLAPGSVQALGGLDAADRAAIMDAAVLMVAPSRRARFPWRVVEALTLGVPVIAAASPDHREIVLDGGCLVGTPVDGADDVTALGEAISEVLESDDTLARLSVLASDRGRAFSWRVAADRIWQLHADL